MEASIGLSAVEAKRTSRQLMGMPIRHVISSGRETPSARPHKATGVMAPVADTECVNCFT